jgi:phospholipid/cholesterol/gamma-HCH transport system ATP-binding protein
VTEPLPAAGASTSRPEDDPICIRVRGIHKTFGDNHHVLRGIELDVERGKINVIIGGSGEGKSVLMKHLMGLLKPDRGEILVDGTDIVPLDDYQLNALRRKFGMLFQYAALFDSMSVFDNVAFPLREHRKGMSKPAVKQAVMDRLTHLGVDHLVNKWPAELSGGQRKRVGLARALVLEPEILLYDEPTTGLDPIQTKNVDEMIVDIAARNAVTSVVISHDMASTFRIAHRISMLSEGRIIESGTPDLFKRTHNPVVRRFVETSGAVDMSTEGAA